MKKAFWIIFAFGCAVVPGWAKVVDKTIATVDSEAIYLSEFNKNWDAFAEQLEKAGGAGNVTPQWEQENKKKLLDQMIDERVLLKEAKRRKLTATQRQIEEGVQQVKDRFKYDEQGEPLSPSAAKVAFDKELGREGLTEKQFQDRIRDQLLVMRLIDEEIQDKTKPPKEDEIKNLFARIEAKINGKNIGNLSPMENTELEAMARFFQTRTGERVRARHILIRTGPSASLQEKTAAKQKAEKIRGDLVKGADFDESAKKYSDDQASAAMGGDLGFFVRGQMVSEFEQTAFSLPVGEISKVVETEFGYHIIKVEEKKAPSKLKYEDVKEELKEYLYRVAAKDKLDEFIKDLKGKTTIKIMTDFNRNGAFAK